MLRFTGDGKQRAALFAALAAAQGAFLPIERNKTVRVTMKSGGTYTFDYADLEEVISKTRPALAKHGLAIVQTLGERTEREIGGQNVTLGLLTTILTHAEGGYLEDEQTFSLGGTNQDMGADITYKRRYSYTCVLGLAAETDDDGGTGARSKAEGREISDRPTRGGKAVPTAGQGDAMNPKNATADEAQAIASMKTAANMVELTSLFNGLPVEMRRPGTNAFVAFHARRTELTAPKAAEAPAKPAAAPETAPLLKPSPGPTPTPPATPAKP